MPGVAFYALGELGDFPDPVENGDTFTENAVIKAQAACEETAFPPSPTTPASSWTRSRASRAS